MERVPYVAILVAYVLVFVPRFVVGREMARQGKYNNHEPRLQQATLEGIGRRAVAAHQNGFEAFAPFAAAVLGAVIRGANLDLVAYLSIGFCVARAGYVWAYLADKAAIRSLLWGLGITATGILMVLAIKGP